MRVIQTSKKTLLYAVMTVCLLLTAFLGSTKHTDAASKYVLKVNRKMNVVTAYKNNVPVRVMLCSTGKNNATPKGTYYTKQKIRWHELDGPVWGQYCTRITGHYLFHSVYYYTNYDKNDLAIKQYRKLGKQASHGCVRLSVEDAKWIYNNCSIGTKVIIYDSKDAGPLGKPLNVQIPKNYKSKWDPTDPDKNNPYYKNRPTLKISSKKKKTVTLGSTYDLMEGVTAKSKAGKNITSRIKVNGKVDVTKPGKYYLKYWVQDTAGNYTYKNFTVTVKKSTKPVFMGLDTSQEYTITNLYRTINYRKGIKAYDRNGKSLTSKIKISFSSSYTKKKAVERVGKNNLRFHKPGTYTVKYTVTGTKSNGKKTTNIKVKFKILDKTLPVITDTVATTTIMEGSVYGKEQILAGVTAKTRFTNVTSRITYQINGQKVEAIDTSVPGTYTINYNLVSATGRSAKTVQRTVIVKPLPVVEPEVPEEEGTTGSTENTDSTTENTETTTEATEAASETTAATEAEVTSEVPAEASEINTI